MYNEEEAIEPAEHLYLPGVYQPTRKDLRRLNWSHSGVWGAQFPADFESGNYNTPPITARKQYKRWQDMKQRLARDPNEIEESPLYGYHAEVDRSYDRIRPTGINWFSCVFGTIGAFLPGFFLGSFFGGRRGGTRGARRLAVEETGRTRKKPGEEGTGNESGTEQPPQTQAPQPRRAPEIVSRGTATGGAANRARTVGILLGTIFAISTLNELCAVNSEDEDFIFVVEEFAEE